MPSDLEDRFQEEMFLIYERAKDECGYHATRFLNMLRERGGLQTAKYLLHAPNLSDGFTALWERERLDLTVEALVLRKPWCDLFDQEELAIARKRLAELGYLPSES